MKDDFCLLKNAKKTEVLDVKLLAKYLNRCPMTVYRWMKLRDPIPFHKAGGTYLFFRDEVLQWLRNR